MNESLSQIIEAALGIGLALIGASHALRPRAWGHLFARTLRHPDGELVIATLSLPVVLLIVIGHPGWTPDARSLVTLYGWVMGIKCVAYLLIPGAAKRMTPARLESGRGFRAVGIGMILLSAVILYASVTSA